MLLPRPVHAEEEEDDPRAELIRRLQEYEQIKSAAKGVSSLARLERDIFTAHAEKPELVRLHSDPVVDMKEVLVALANVLKRAEMFQRHAVQLEVLSVNDRMQEILSRVSGATDFVPFAHLFTADEGRAGVVVAFLALMELIRESLLDFVQNEPFAPIYVRAAGE